MPTDRSLRLSPAPARAGWLAKLCVLALAAILACAAAQAPQAALAQTPAAEETALRDDGLIRLDQIDGGALLFFTDEPGFYVQAPLVSTNIDVVVAGAVARTVVTQRFTNPAEVFVEGKYVFPLPEDSAVDVLRMKVADRLIEGEIKEREEAKEIYETAKAEGFVASLVEQERPNLFTTSVANIGPGDSVTIQIEYQETIAPRDGVFGLRLPLVVAPRYTPDPKPLLVKFGPEGWYEADADPVPDRARVTPPVADPRREDPSSIRNPVEISIDLQAGFPLGPVKSLYHEVSVKPSGANGAAIALKGPAPADRDFYLSWRPERIDEPYLTLFTEGLEREAEDGEATKERSYLLMLTPPSADAIGDTRRPREVIFVQDISGSMFGESMEQAKKGLEMAVQRLRPDDTFNIIVFNDRFGQFADEPLEATAENIEKAVEAVRALQADGGTEMLPALEAALKDPNRAEDERVRQVIFLTDGAVSNEQQMLELIQSDLGRSRLFTVGIGAAPNSYFMTAAVEAGRGTHVFIGDIAEVQERMEALFQRIETPAMVDLSLDVAGFNSIEVWPNPMPDLYAGDPVIATIKVDERTPTRAIPEVTLRGERAGEPWTESLRLAAAEERPGVAKLWARQKIRSLEALRLSQSVDRDGIDRIDQEILDTALGYGLVSRLTSLVAVDVTPTRPADAPLVEKDVPLNLPAGWDPRFFFSDGGEQPAPPVQDAQRDAPVKPAALTRLAAAAEARTQAAALGAPLPATAAPWRLTLAIGLLLALVGLFGLWRLRRRPAAPA
ncbi:MAG: marine proteobacterial sortase target protein [Pseudomonadota bacterium]